MQKISMHELHQKLPRLGPRELILDVREPDEFREGHILGSKNIPVGEVGSRFEELKGYDRVYIHCRAGRRAQNAFFELEKKGLNNLVCIADSGMADWVAAGYETEKGAS